MNRWISLTCIIGLVTTLLFRNLAHSYDNYKAHPAINKAIVGFFENKESYRLPQGYSVAISTQASKYKGPAVTDGGFAASTTHENDVEYTSLEWISHGGFSADEPELAAAVRHFYDPVGLNGGRKNLTNRGTYWEGVYPNPGIDAIEWALGDTPNSSGNIWSLKYGKWYMKELLQTAEADVRSKYIAKAFRCLGEVLHNTGDMGCPPHTRNDSHAAPIGFTVGQYVLGSPDPYEELFDPQWATRFKDNRGDPALESFFENATTIRSIDEKLAEFTNKNFFTAQTINGQGWAGSLYMIPLNSEGTYPAPLLHELDYNRETSTYSRIFPSGNEVKLCKDHYFYLNWQYPGIDQECVESQAAELVPNILRAGANIVRLFIPELTVTLSQASLDGAVTGKVTHTPTSEYPINERIYYSGPILILDAQSLNQLGTIECKNGDFSGKVSERKAGDRILAAVEFGGVRVISKEIEVTGTDLRQYNTVVFEFSGDMANGPAGTYYPLQIGVNNTTLVSAQEFTPLVWSGNSFSYSFDVSVPGGNIVSTYSRTIHGELSVDMTKILSLHASTTSETRREGQEGLVSSVSTVIDLQNLPVSGRFPEFGASGSTVQALLTGITHKYCDYSKTPPCFELTSIDWSRPDIYGPRVWLALGKRSGW